jgi:hypothetical protein
MISFKSILFACIIIGIAFLSGCSKKETEEISSDEIFKDSAKSATPGAEKFKEPDEVTAAKTASAPLDYTPSFSESGRFVVQCNVYSSSKSAKRLADNLSQKGYPSYVAEVENPKPEMTGMFYRVRTGNFAGVSIAKEFAEKVLVAMGYEYWVDNKSNDNLGKGSSSGYGSEGSSSYTPAASEPAPMVTPSMDMGGSSYGSSNYGSSSSGTTSETPAAPAPDYGSSSTPPAAPAPPVTPEPPAAPSPGTSGQGSNFDF